MGRLKTFRTWLILFVLLYLFVDFISFVGLKMMLKDLNEYEILVESPKIEITEAKGTYANGYIKGTLTNDTNSIIENKYIKLDVYSERNVNLGTEYIEIEKLDLAKTIDFEVKYNYTDVANYKIDVVDTKPELEQIQLIKYDEETKLWATIAGIFALWIIIT